MNRILVAALISLFLLSSCTAPTPEGIDVRKAWTRPATQGGNGAVYFVIRSSEADELVGISSPVAEAAEMHESKMNGDIMEMHQLEFIPLGADELVTFAPGGLHIMLIGLKQDLKIGDQVEVILHFKNYEDLQLDVPVTDTPASEHEGT